MGDMAAATHLLPLLAASGGEVEKNGHAPDADVRRSDGRLVAGRRQVRAAVAVEVAGHEVLREPGSVVGPVRGEVSSPVALEDHETARDHLRDGHVEVAVAVEV